MSDLSRHRPYLVRVSVVVVIVLTVGVLLVPMDGWIAMDERRSSDRVTPDGVAAWARSLEALGVDVQRRYSDLTTDPPTGAGLVILEPIVGLSAGEAHEVLEWVRAGGTLVFSPAFGAELSDSLRIRAESRAPDELDAFGDLEPTFGPDSLVPHRWTDEPTGWTSHSPYVVASDSAGVDRWDALTIPHGENDGVSLAWAPEGDGGVLLVADAEELANRTLADSPLAPTITRAVVDRVGAGTLFFSEYHQALDGSRGVMRESLAIAWAQPLGRVLLHAAAMGALLMILSGRRFGSPLPGGAEARRSTVEHVDALARIYRTARAHGTVAHYLVRSTARRMGLPPTAASDAELVASWGRRSALAVPAAAASDALASDPPDLEQLEASLDSIVERYTEGIPS